MSDSLRDHYRNVGHGHVFPRPDGIKARCGGPGLCTACSHDAVSKVAGEEESAGDVERLPRFKDMWAIKHVPSGSWDQGDAQLILYPFEHEARHVCINEAFVPIKVRVTEV